MASRDASYNPGTPGRLSDRPPTGYRPGYDDAPLSGGPIGPGGPGFGGPGGPGGFGGPGGPTGPQHGRVLPAEPRGRRLIDYPRYDKDGWRRWIPSWKLVTSVFSLGILMMVILFLWAYATTTIPSPDAAISAQTTIIYFSDGRTEIGRLSTQNRVNVQLGQVPDHVQNAVLAAEDHTFYENNGVDPKSLVRAAWSNLRGNATQGGSTITQQYVKNVYDLRDRSIQRKAREFFIALKINRTQTKSQILERYLNTIYMGRNAYGIGAATQAYFGRNARVDKLTVSQGAFLAGLINAPSLTDPAKEEGKERAQRRWNVVLDAMVEDGKLSAADRAKQTFPKVLPVINSSLKGQNGYMMQMAEEQAAIQLGVSADDIERGGYAITTTFQQNLVVDAAKAVKQQLSTVKGRPRTIQAGLVTIDPKNGAVRAMYGGPDYVDHPFNNAYKGTAQAGSTFKAFGLMAALQDDVSLRSRFSGQSPMDFKDAKRPVRNFGNESLRTMNLLDATAKSVNTVYVALNELVGPDRTAKVAHAAGIPASVNIEDNLVNVLGTASPRVIDMANAYATFADGGVYHKWYVIESVGKIESNSRDNRYSRVKDGEFKAKTVFDTGNVDDLTYALQQVVKRGSGTYARSLDRDVAGKTGTSTSSLSAWFVGYTPQYATAVAMWQDAPDGLTQVPMKGFGGFRSITGGSFPVRIWTEYMKDALEGKPKLEFNPPDYGGEFEGTPAPKPIITTAAPTETVGPTASPTSEPSPTDDGGGTNPFPTLTLPTLGNGGGGNGRPKPTP